MECGGSVYVCLCVCVCVSLSLSLCVCVYVCLGWHSRGSIRARG